MEMGKGENIDDSLRMLGLGRDVAVEKGEVERWLPFKCPSRLQPVSEERQCGWQLVTETAGCPAHPCLWSRMKWRRGQKKMKRRCSLIITVGQKPCLCQQETSATWTPGWHIRQYLCCHSAPLVLLPLSICPSPTPHPPVQGALGVVS